MKKPIINILTYILDDQQDLIDTIDEFFKLREVYNYRLFTDPDDMIKALTSDVAVCIIDYRLNNKKSGVAVMKEVKKTNAACYFIVMSAELTRDLVVECVNNGANKVILKDDPNFMDLLIEYLQEAIDIVTERFETYSRIWENFIATDKLFEQLKRNNESRNLESDNNNI